MIQPLAGAPPVSHDLRADATDTQGERKTTYFVDCFSQELVDMFVFYLSNITRETRMVLMCMVVVLLQLLWPVHLFPG